MRRLFITGVGGFIGARLAARAMARGVEVSGIDLSPRAVEAARRLGIEASVCDIGDEAGVGRALAGSDTVIHTAAIVREYGPLADFRRVNVQGSARVARAARDGGATTFVQLSSVMVYGFNYPPQVAEEGPLVGEGNPYCQTKIESELAVRALSRGEFGVIVIRPGDVYGPGSVPWVARPLEMMRKGRLLLPMGGRGVINHVYVDNLVDGIFMAIDAGAHGQTFNISDGEATAYGDYFGMLAARAGLRGPRNLPTPVMLAGARAIELLRARGLTRDEASVDTVRYLSRRNTYGIDTARRVLGYAPTIKLDEGLALTQPFIDDCMA